MTFFLRRFAQVIDPIGYIRYIGYNWSVRSQKVLLIREPHFHDPIRDDRWFAFQISNQRETFFLSRSKNTVCLIINLVVQKYRARTSSTLWRGACYLRYARLQSRFVKLKTCGVARYAKFSSQKLVLVISVVSQVLQRSAHWKIGLNVQNCKFIFF